MCSEINNKLGEGGCGMDLPDNMLFYLQIFFKLKVKHYWETGVIQVDHLSILNL